MTGSNVWAVRNARAKERAENAGAELCVCGHKRNGHHPLCNGHVGKFWCQCRGFIANEKEVSA